MKLSLCHKLNTNSEIQSSPFLSFHYSFIGQT